jgi:hypothetical protein
MSITFKITTGTITNDEDSTVLTSSAYAGNDSRIPQNPNRIHGKNNPNMCSVHFIGPLPPGKYNIGSFENHPVVGENSAQLTQISGNTFGRSAFFIHGQEAPNGSNYLQESEGCIVVPHNDRLKIAALAPKILTVIV